MAKIASMGLPASLLKKLVPPMDDITDLHVLTPVNLQHQYSLTPKQWDALNDRLKAFGAKPLGEYPYPKPRPAPKSSTRGLCKRPVMEDGTAPTEDVEYDQTVLCLRKNKTGKQQCEWHWLMAQPIADQVAAAEARFKVAAGPLRTRVPAEEWPEGERWCSQCQQMIPLFYCRGSRCLAHASAAAHASMVKRVYDLTPADYNNLLAWQRGRCYICQQLPRSKRLAVDHDHRTGEVRGLLCANDEWGCNHTLARVLNDEGMARRLLEYVQKAPMRRLADGEPAPEVKVGLAGRVGSRTAPGDPFAGFLS